MIARFFRSDAMIERLGEAEDKVVEAEWFQLTYGTLRSAPDGDDVAFYTERPDVWFTADGGVAYSDVVISASQD